MMHKTNNTSAGKGGVRRRESKSGSFDVGHALIAWDSTAGNVDTQPRMAPADHHQ